MTIKTPVTVKAVVTEELQRRLAAEVQETLRRLETELAQVQFQLRRAVSEREKSNSAELAVLVEKLEQDAVRRQEIRSQLVERLKSIARLQPGELVVQGTAEGLVEIRPGMRWEQVTSTEIIIKNGVVMDIRLGGEERCE
ncbi:MAG: YlqD family protein [Bacillota bacterium]